MLFRKKTFYHFPICMRCTVKADAMGVLCNCVGYIRPHDLLYQERLSEIELTSRG